MRVGMGVGMGVGVGVSIIPKCWLQRTGNHRMLKQVCKDLFSTKQRRTMECSSTLHTHKESIIINY